MSMIQPISSSDFNIPEFEMEEAISSDYSYEMEAIEDITGHKNSGLRPMNESFLAFGVRLFYGFGRLHFLCRKTGGNWGDFVPIFSVGGMMLPVGWALMLQSPQFASTQSRRFGMKVVKKRGPSIKVPVFKRITRLGRLKFALNAMVKSYRDKFDSSGLTKLKDTITFSHNRLRALEAWAQLNQEEEFANHVAKFKHVRSRLLRGVKALEYNPTITIGTLNAILKRTQKWLTLMQDKQPNPHKIKSELTLVKRLIDDPSLEGKLSSTTAMPIELSGLKATIIRFQKRMEKLKNLVVDQNENPFLHSREEIVEMSKKLEALSLPTQLKPLKEELLKDLKETDETLGEFRGTLKTFQKDVYELVEYFGKSPHQVLNLVMNEGSDISR